MKDAVVMVTGAASGIGRAVCEGLAESGAKLALCDVDEAQGRSLAQSLGGLFVRCDVADAQNMASAIDMVTRTLGTPTHAHLNAGIMTVPTNDPFLAIQDVSLEAYRRILGVNLDGVFHGLKLLLPPMLAAGAPGAITVTASTAAFGALPVDPLYSATKHALVGLTRSVAAANAEGPVRINAICPGVVDTAIVPERFKAPEFGMVSAAIMAAEVLDLLAQGANGEIRVKAGDRPAFAVAPQDLSG